MRNRRYDRASRGADGVLAGRCRITIQALLGALEAAQRRPRIVTEEEVRREDAESVRATLALSPDMRRIIERLAADSGMDEAEVFRRAIGLLKIVKEGQQRGELPALVDKDGAITTTITGF